MKILVCGGAGFIGSNFIHYILENRPHYEVVNYDALTYAGNLGNLKDIENKLEYSSRYTFIKGNITDYKLLSEVVQKYSIDHIINFAAETHVDRSIYGDCTDFVMTNTYGVLTVLNVVRNFGIEKFVNVSTDEVYGSLGFDDAKKFTEDTPFAPNMPYAAAKAGGDLMCHSYFATHGLPVIVTHCSNNYGRFQYPEKLIPSSIFRVLREKPILIHGSGNNIRDWIHVRDHCTALLLMLEKGKSGEVYNIGSDNERSNLEIAKLILSLMHKNESLVEFVEDRPGNDLRYAIDATKIRALGRRPVYTREQFEVGLSETINWYLTNLEWVEALWNKHEEAYQINHSATRIKLEKKKAKKILEESKIL